MLSSQIFLLQASETASSVSFSNSYLQRASGIEALYWNPANIPNFATKYELIPIPTVFSFTTENDNITLKLYNKLMVDFLEDEVKDELLNSIVDNYMNINMSSRLIALGFSHGNFAYSTATNVAMKGKFDRQFIEMALYGNVYDKTYDFSQEHNDYKMIVYQDITAGYGGFNLNQFLPAGFEYIPNVNVGISASFLLGQHVSELVSFKGNFSTSNEEGLNVYQESVIKLAGFMDKAFNTHFNGIGTGLKFGLGVSVDAYQFDENHFITAGLAIDNIAAYIRWRNNTAENHYIISGESVYVDDMVEDFYEYEEISNKIGAFTTRLPLNLKLGTMYRWNDLTASLDYQQYFGSSKAYYYDPAISLGAEYIIFKYFPIQKGIRFPIGDLPLTNSLGFGYRGEKYEVGISFQSVGAYYTYSSKGLSTAMQMKFRF